MCVFRSIQRPFEKTKTLSMQVEENSKILFTDVTHHNRRQRVIPCTEHLTGTCKLVIGFSTMELEDSMLVGAWWTLRWYLFLCWVNLWFWTVLHLNVRVLSVGVCVTTVVGDFKTNNSGSKLVNLHLPLFTDSNWSTLVHWLIPLNFSFRVIV